MPSAVRLREDYSAEELRELARRSKDVNQSRRLRRWRGFETEWTEGRPRGSAAWPPDALRLGSPLQRFGSGRASR